MLSKDEQKQLHETAMAIFARGFRFATSGRVTDGSMRQGYQLSKDGRGIEAWNIRLPADIPIMVCGLEIHSAEKLPDRHMTRHEECYIIGQPCHHDGSGLWGDKFFAQVWTQLGCDPGKGPESPGYCDLIVVKLFDTWCDIFAPEPQEHTHRRAPYGLN